MYLLPRPQVLKLTNGYIKRDSLHVKNHCEDSRIAKALLKLPNSEEGIELEVYNKQEDSEGYSLTIEEKKIVIIGDSAAGTFYGIQTLRQIYDNDFQDDKIPCLIIEDKPGMSYRGFYHDVTRGKIPTIETLRSLIDQMAYVKMNSLQLYIEHTFPFREFGDHVEKNGYLTPEEIKELDDYCYENFIEFIPSIATFGHLYELLEQESYRDLRELKDFKEERLYWDMRMAHHTINPTEERSIEIIKSMIDQFLPLFRTDRFNICCDETFDLKKGVHKDQDTGKLYIEFVKKIIAHLQSKGKIVMMWADILFQHPETIEELPDNVEFLSCGYSPNEPEEPYRYFGGLQCTQIVCPGTGSWSRLVEAMEDGSKNILKSGEYGYKYHAKGMLNTNWGDWGNPCSLELAMHGLALGASKAWNRETDKDSYFTESIQQLIYKNDECVKYLHLLDAVNKKISWNRLAKYYSNCIYEKKYELKAPEMEHVLATQQTCNEILETLKGQVWERDDYRKEIMLAAEGLLVMAELFAKFAGYEVKRISDTYAWLEKYSSCWKRKNKDSELFRIIDMFKTLEDYPL